VTTHTRVNRFVTGENGKQKREESRTHELKKCTLLCEKEEPHESFRLIQVCSGKYFFEYT